MRNMDEVDNSFRLVVMSDSQGYDNGINETALRKLLDTVKSLEPQPRYIVFTGDLVTGSKLNTTLQSQLENFKRVFSSYFPAERLLSAAGNHDLGRRAEDDCREIMFSKVFSEHAGDDFLNGYNRTVYYLDIGGTRLILLNSYHYDECNEISGEQLEWFEKVVSKPAHHKIVFVHSPPFPTGAHVNKPLNKYPYEQYNFWSIIDRNDVSLIICGHEHNYSRRLIDEKFNRGCFKFSRGIYQIITGGAGGKLSDSFRDSKNVIVPPKPVNHFVVLDISNIGITVTAISIDGAVIDSFELKKGLEQ
ncbi:MAG: metallophosphoesterase [Bacillota bacterium]|nr:metallophosphoesterase [Bacillota bacterium]